jgi:2-oxoglutarate ferredoxin oxidoreductase subunit alpha
MEDEIASMAALIGASYAGAKAMTATSGPGLSLMLENISLAYIMESPCVIVDVQRSGPCTGIPTLVGQGDMMQAKWGSGDIEAIAYNPSSVQEFFDLTIQAFNTAERFRTPVFILADQVVAMMWEKLVVPAPEDVEVVERSVLEASRVGEGPFDYSKDFLPMPLVGSGCKVNIDGLTHDSKGYPSTDHSVSESMTSHLAGKIRNHASEIWKWEEFLTEDAKVVVVAYGGTARSALSAVKLARSKGIRAALLRLITPWPFPDEIVRKLSGRVDALVVPEINNGQMVHSVRENANCPVVGISWAPGSLVDPEMIVDALEVVASR